jgi:diguanylate cyclase (GGDEF)-like protein
MQAKTEHSTSDRLLGVIRTQTDIVRLGLDLGGVITLVSERAMNLTGAAGAVVELAEGQEMVYRAAAGNLEKQLGLRLARGGSLSGLCIESRCALVCEDSETDSRVNREACRRVGLRSMVVVPLKHQEELVGVLKVASPQAGFFGTGEVELLELMSGLIAAAMFHAARYGADELFYRATHDALTGLANRALFFDRLRNGLEQAQRDASRIGILNVDMDGLKPINDQFGHRAGDAALKEMGARMRAEVAESDTVARVGGDEFGLILPRVGDQAAMASRAGRFASRIGGPFCFEQHSMTLGASVGYALFPDDGEQIDVLIEKADHAMYEAKRGRKARWRERGGSEPEGAAA